MTETDIPEISLSKWFTEIIERDITTTANVNLIKSLFTPKPPEPYFGKWVDDKGNLSLKGKTIVTLINPGNGISFNHCINNEISLCGKNILKLFKEFYTNGSVNFNKQKHYLPYKRSLSNPKFNYTLGTKDFAWGWWRSQWKNMLKAIGKNEDTNEEKIFLTLELFAYSSSKANSLNSSIINSLCSSQYVLQIIHEIIKETETSRDRKKAPESIILVNKREIWEPFFMEKGYVFHTKKSNKAKNPTVSIAMHNGKETIVPLILLENAQKMKFPLDLHEVLKAR